MSRQPHLSASARSFLAGATLLPLFLLWAGSALAAARYVAPGGSDSNPGSSPGSAWATIGKANATLQPGDVCYVAAGTYSHLINPARDGTSSARITYIGNPGNPASVVVPLIEMNKSYITVKGFTATDAGELHHPARFDSIAFCVLGRVQFAAAKDCMIAHNIVNGKVGWYANGGKGCYNKLVLDNDCFANNERDTLRGNAIDLGRIAPGHKGFDMRAWTQRCVIDSNQISILFDKTGSTSVDESFALIMFHSYNNQFRDNRWTMDAATPTACSNCNWDAFRLRDSTHSNTWERDTMRIGLNSSNPIRFMFSASGDFDNYNKFNRWTSCFIQTRNSLWCEDYMDEWTIENSVLMASNNRVLQIPDWRNSKLRHNTFWAPGQTVWIDAMTGTSNDISSNIFYSVNASQATSNGGGVFFNGSRTPSGFTSDNNLFFTPTSRSSAGDLSLMWCCWGSSKPGAGTTWASMTGQDTHSKHGSPRFIDSTFAAFNPRLGSGSLARGLGAGGSDAGVQWVTDQTPPAVVSQIDTALVSDRFLVLKWTAPGDDGSIGTASAYDLRWSNSPLTAANFTAASPVSSQPLPLPAGSLQQHIVFGLVPSTNYYFAIRARDEAGNWSGVSPATYVRTLSFDRQPPASVKDLATGP